MKGESLSKEARQSLREEAVMSALGQLYLVLGQPLEKCAVHAAQDEQLARQFFS